MYERRIAEFRVVQFAAIEGCQQAVRESEYVLVLRNNEHFVLVPWTHPAEERLGLFMRRWTDGYYFRRIYFALGPDRLQELHRSTVECYPRGSVLVRGGKLDNQAF